MSMQPQQSGTTEIDTHNGKKRSRQRRLILTIVIALIIALAIIVVQVLGNLQLIPAVWTIISSAVVGVLGVVLGFFALFPVLFPPENEPSQPVHIPIIISGGTAHEAIDTNADSPHAHHIILKPHEDTHPHAETHKTAFRGIIGVLPPTDPKVIEQREKNVADVYEQLLQPDVTSIALTGISGVGKSTLAALVYNHAEQQRKARSGPFKAEPIWLTIRFDIAMIDLIGTLCEKLNVPLPDLDHLTPQNQAAELFNILNSIDKSRLIVLDQFENFLDTQSGVARVERPGIDEWVDVINSQLLDWSGCRLLLTSRTLPRGTYAHAPIHLQEYCVEGLTLDEGIDLLKKQGVSSAATEDEFRLAVESCRGHAYSLTLLGALVRNHHVSLAEIFKDPDYQELWEGDIASNILDIIYEKQLSATQRQILQGFSVYREAVPLRALQEALDPAVKIAKRELLPAITALINMHLLQATSDGRYELHAIVAHYARHHFDDHDEQHNNQLLHAAHARAAQYYRQQAITVYPPLGKRSTIKDVEPLIEATWQLVHAQQSSAAYELMEQEELFTDLDRMGGSSILLELYNLLLPAEKWQATPVQAACVYKNAGRVYSRFAEREKSKDYYNRALQLYKDAGNHVDQCEVLIYLSEAYHDSDVSRALECCRMALVLSREAGNRKYEALTLNNLSWIYKSLGELEKGRTSGEQALSIYRDLEDLWGESRCLDALGEVYTALGLVDQAQASFEQALQMYRKVGNHWQEGWMLIHLGNIYKDQGQSDQAQKNFEQALEAGKKVKNHWVENGALNGLGSIYLSLQQIQPASEYYQQSLKLSREIKDTWGETRVLHNLARLHTSQGQQAEALGYLREAFPISKAIGNHLESISILHDLSTIYIDQKRYNIALAFLLLAKADHGKTQNPEMNKIQALFETLRTKVGADAFTELLKEVEADYSQLTTQALQADAATI